MTGVIFSREKRINIWCGHEQRILEASETMMCVIGILTCGGVMILATAHS